MEPKFSVTRPQNKPYSNPLNHLRRSPALPILDFLHSSYKLKSGLRGRGAASIFPFAKQRGHGRRIAVGLGSFVRRTKPPGGAGSLRFGFVCSSANPRPGAPLLELGSFFQFRESGSLFHANRKFGFVFSTGSFSSRGGAIKQLQGGARFFEIRSFVRESTPGAPLLELGSFFQIRESGSTFRANCNLGSFFQPSSFSSRGCAIRQLQGRPAGL